MPPRQSLRTAALTAITTLGLTTTFAGPRAAQATPDVTGIVSGWFGGAPNYGLIVRNTDENLNPFTNAICETSYVNPQLDVVYQ